MMKCLRIMPQGLLCDNWPYAPEPGGLGFLHQALVVAVDDVG